MDQPLRRLALATALVVGLGGCSSPPSPLAPGQVVVQPPQPLTANFTGTWTGVVDWTSCSSANTPGYASTCPRGIPGQPSTYTLDFALTQSGLTVAGRVSRDHTSRPAPMVVGQIGADGALVLREEIVTDKLVMDGYIVTTAITWTLAATADGHLTGTMLSLTESGGTLPGWRRQEGTIRTATRTNTP